MKKLFLLLIICLPFLTNAHGFDESELVINATGVQLSGTLTLPAHAHGNMPLVIIIAGSGPTDRDCNGQGFKSDAYKKMAAQHLQPIIICSQQVTQINFCVIGTEKL